MHEFYVQFHSLQDVKDFAALAADQTVSLNVGGDRFQVHATSFMGLFALNCRNRQKVRVECSEEELEALLVTFARFLAE